MSNRKTKEEIVSFVKKIATQGRHYVIFIPKEYIDSHSVDPNYYYEVSLRKLRRKEGTKTYENLNLLTTEVWEELVNKGIAEKLSDGSHIVRDADLFNEYMQEIKDKSQEEEN